MTSLDVGKDNFDHDKVPRAGGDTILEYWIPAEDLDEFKRHILGLIEVVREFR